MFKASSDDRGTVQALAKELDEAREDGMQGSHSILASMLTTNPMMQTVCFSL
jgi:hypothetical protein